MTKNKLAIIGAGGLAREMGDYPEKVGFKKTVFLLDENYFKKNSTPKVQYELFRLKRNLSKFLKKGYQFIVGIGDPKVRKAYTDLLNDYSHSIEWATVIDPGIDPGEWTTVKEGSFIARNTSLTTNIKIGKHVIINQNCSIGHDTVIGDYTTVSPGAMISGNVTIGKNCYIGTGALIREKINIPDNTVIGMGAVVVKDIKKSGTYIGNPAFYYTSND